VIELEKRLASGLDAKAEASIRRWLADVATELQED
jgi:hypothetical protein